MQQHTPEPSNPRDTVWTPTALKALLQLRRSALPLLQQEPLHGWLAERGGVEVVYEHLRTCRLPPHLRALLDLILSQPGATAQFYAASLWISLRTYFNHLRELEQALLGHLERLRPAHAAAAPPALRPASNLPASLTSLVGAEQMAAAAVALIRQGGVRLLTITGPGGIGKTRLGLRVASELEPDFADGAFFVELASLSDPALVLDAAARALRLQGGQGDPLEILREYLQPRQVLLALDNFEHLLGAAPQLGELLRAAPGLHVLVTSRELLQLYGEHEFPVAALDVPPLQPAPALDELERYAAVRLFVERARAASPDFALGAGNGPDVARICQLVAGVPLGIELAAAWVHLLPCSAIAGEIAADADFLTTSARDVPERQRTLRAVFEWSWRLLSPEEQRVFAALAVFCGGFDHQAAASVAGATLPLLRALLNKSLIRTTAQGHYDLHELLRQYAAEKLAGGGHAAEVRQRYRAWYLAVISAADAEQDVLHQQWQERLALDHDNLRAVLQQALQEGDLDVATRCVAALWRFWRIRGYYAEGYRWATAVLDQPAAQASPAAIRALYGGGWLAIDHGDTDQASQWFGQSMELARAAEQPRDLAMAMQGLGFVCQVLGEYLPAQQHYQAGYRLLRELDDTVEIAWSLDHLGHIAHLLGDNDRAQALIEQSLELFRPLNHQWGMLLARFHLGEALLAQGRAEQAQVPFEQTCAQSEAIEGRHGRMLASALSRLGEALLYQGKLAEAHATLESCLSISRAGGYDRSISQVLCSLARLALLQDQPADAARDLAECVRIQRRLQQAGRIVEVLELAAALALASGDLVRAAQLSGAATALRETHTIPHHFFSQQLHDSTCAALHAALPPDRLAAAWQQGRAMGQEQALAFALAGLE